MLLRSLVLGAALMRDAAPSDSITTSTLLLELPVVTSFSVFKSSEGPVPTLLAQSKPPADARLGALQRELRFAMTWLIEGAASYDRAGLLHTFGDDTVAMRRAAYGAMQIDSSFVRPLLRLAAPLLESKGTTIVDGPRVVATRISAAKARAVAARYFQVQETGGRTGMTVCAKPRALRDRQLPEDAAYEAWFYSVVRAEAGMGALGIAAEVFEGVPKGDARAMEQELWKRLESNEKLGALLGSAYRRTSAWAPVAISD